MARNAVVILGGGVGGVVAANELRKRLGDGHRIVLVERNREFLFCPLAPLADGGLATAGAGDEGPLPIAPPGSGADAG